MTHLGEERICPICGKEFLPTPDWLFRNTRRSLWFCSYSCKRKFDTDANNAPKKRGRLSEEKKQFLIKLLKNGFTIKEVATELRISVDTVRYWQERIL